MHTINGKIYENLYFTYIKCKMYISFLDEDGIKNFVSYACISQHIVDYVIDIKNNVEER